jgi:hypothetical protein
VTIESAAVQSPGHYGSLVPSEAFLRWRAISGRLVSVVLFAAAALSVFVTASIIVYILVYDSRNEALAANSSRPG